jgi:hypothetical protein
MNEEAVQCPVCGTPISQTRYREIQARIRKEEQAKLAIHTEHLRAQHEKTLKAATQEAARKARQEVGQKLTQAQLNEKKQAERIAQLEANEATLRKNASRAQEQMRAQHDAALKAATAEAARKAKQEAEQKLAQAQLKEKKQAERIAHLEASEATLRANASRVEERLKTKFAQDLKGATEKAAQDARAGVKLELNAKDAEMRTLKEAHAEELKQQRATLDEHRDLEVQKVRKEHARETEALQKKVQELNRKLEQKTAHELGEFPEIDLYQALSEAFPGDKIRRVKKGEPGADIVHEVMHNGQYCQTIVYDSKNRRIFQQGFIQKLLVDKANAKAEHAVLVTAMFPTGQRDLCVVDGVVVARLSQVVTIAAMLRDSIVTDHLRNLSFKDRTEKKERLYNLITSETFRQRIAAVERAVRDLEKIDAREADEHRKVWNQRSVQYRTVDKSVRDLVTEVNVILQSPGCEVAVDVAGVHSVSPLATGTDDPAPR